VQAATLNVNERTAGGGRRLTIIINGLWLHRSHVVLLASASERRHDTPGPTLFRAPKQSETAQG
jgi:hypothetical protein